MRKFRLECTVVCTDDYFKSDMDIIRQDILSGEYQRTLIKESNGGIIDCKAAYIHVK